MPAEWEKQQSTLIGWPYNKNDWPGKFKNIPNVFAKIISNITKSQGVNLLIKNSKSKKTIKRLLNGSGENNSGVAVSQGNWVNAGVRDSENFYPFHTATSQLVHTNSSGTWAFGLKHDEAKHFHPTNTGYIYSVKNSRAILHKYKDVKGTFTSKNMALTHSVVRNYGNKNYSSEHDIIKTTVNNRGEIEKTKIIKLAGSIDCKDEILSQFSIQSKQSRNFFLKVILRIFQHHFFFLKVMSGEALQQYRNWFFQFFLLHLV